MAFKVGHHAFSAKIMRISFSSSSDFDLPILRLFQFVLSFAPSQNAIRSEHSREDDEAIRELQRLVIIHPANTVIFQLFESIKHLKWRLQRVSDFCVSRLLAKGKEPASIFMIVQRRIKQAPHYRSRQLEVNIRLHLNSLAMGTKKVNRKRQKNIISKRSIRELSENEEEDQKGGDDVNGEIEASDHQFMSCSKSQSGEVEEESRDENAERSNYFSQIHRRSIRNFFVNLFIRKLKQVIVREDDFDHPLLEEGQQVEKSWRICRFNLSLEILWNFILIAQILVLFFYSTLSLAYPEFEHSQTTRFLALGCLLVHSLEMLLKICVESSLNFYTSPVRSFKAGLAYDLCVLAILMIDSIQAVEGLKWWRVLLVFKMMGVHEKIKNLEILLIQTFHREQYWELVKLLLLNLIFSHMISIMLMLISRGSNNWLTAHNIQHLEWFEKYIWANYWATTIMLTVGFGDIVASNTSQALAMIFISMMGCILFTYNINSVGQILNNINSGESEKETNIKVFMRMKEREPLSLHAKSRIINYINESSDMKRKYNVEEEERLKSSLPEALLEEFHREINHKMFESLPFFKHVSNKTLGELAFKLERKLAHPEQIVLCQGKVPDVAILSSGEVNLNMYRPGHQSHGRKFQVIKSEGENRLLSLYFIYSEMLPYHVKCSQYSIMYLLPKEELVGILRKNAYNYQYYLMLRDKDNYNPNEKQAVQCQHCKTFHTLDRCPKFHYLPLKQLVMRRKQKKKGKKAFFIPRTRKGSKKFFNPRGKITFEDNEEIQDFIRRVTINKTICFGESETALKFIYENLSNDIKEEVSKVPLLLNEQKMFEWELESDKAYDFEFYFPKFNPTNLRPRVQELKLRARNRKK